MSEANRWGSYHEGELAVQRRAGVARKGLKASQMYHAGMPAGVRRFLPLQQIAVLATVDSDGRLWASLRSGQPGFLQAIDDQILQIGGYGHPGDPLLANLASHDAMGMLVIDLAGRNRLRLNGTAEALADGEILLATKQVYGNCQKYIQARAIIGERTPLIATSAEGVELNEHQQNWLAQTDTFFIATAHSRAGADASHRGGKPGFVRIEDERRLIFPDYRGNEMFNSLGNIALNSRAGLLFPDFQTGNALQVTGIAEILWEDSRILEFAGAQRLVRFDVERVIELLAATHLRFEFASYSPDLPS